MEELCVFIDIAKSLKEYGYPQKCENYWHSHDILTGDKYENLLLSKTSYEYDIENSGITNFKFVEGIFLEYGAPTVGELINSLPMHLTIEDKNKATKDVSFNISCKGILYFVNYGSIITSDMHFLTALAMMWLMLKKKRLI